VKDKWSKVLIAILVIAGMLMGGIETAFAAEPYHVLSGRDKVGTYGQDGKSARVGFLNTTCIEGDTSNAYETCVTGVDPTADNVILFPDSSGTVQLTSGAFAGALADTKAYVGNSAGVAVAQNLSIINDVTATMTNSGIFNATIPASTITSEMIGIANVHASDVFTNTVTGSVAGGQTGMDIVVESGSILVDTQKISGFSNDITLNASYIGAANTWIINVSAHGATPTVVNGIFWRP
jgi:hypothetical protein